LSGRLFLGEGSDARARLESLVNDHLEQHDQGYRIKGARPVRQGVISWEV
jgi:hypothetical protein